VGGWETDTLPPKGQDNNKVEKKKEKFCAPRESQLGNILKNAVVTSFFSPTRWQTFVQLGCICRNGSTAPRSPGPLPLPKLT